MNAAGVTRADIAEQLQLVGNLGGAASVEVAPKINGRLRQIDVRLGDPVTRGQEIARVEDDELRQQVNQAEASYEVARATVRQREADLVLARTNRERSENLFARSLLSRQDLDDAEARYQAANAQLDLAGAQFDEAGARLEELRINLENTIMVSPVDGFISHRYVDPGAYVTSNTAVVSVVDISLVRLVANLVERDLRLVERGVSARIEVDAFPSESFAGRVARISPILDPATRTAEIEIRGSQLRLPVEAGDVRARQPRRRQQEPGVGRAARGRGHPHLRPRGLPGGHPRGGPPTAQFVSLVTGLEDERHVEVLDGLAEGDRVVTTGAAGLQHGDPILLADAGRPGGAPLGRSAPPGALSDRRPRPGAAAGPGAPPDALAERNVPSADGPGGSGAGATGR